MLPVGLGDLEPHRARMCRYAFAHLDGGELADLRCIILYYIILLVMERRETDCFVGRAGDDLSESGYAARVAEELFAECCCRLGMEYKDEIYRERERDVRLLTGQYRWP